MGMSEQKMREALELADCALSGANMNMNVVMRKVKEALAHQPVVVELTDDEIESSVSADVLACVDRIKKAIGKEQPAVAMNACYMMMQAIEFLWLTKTNQEKGSE